MRDTANGTNNLRATNTHVSVLCSHGWRVAKAETLRGPLRNTVESQFSRRVIA
jgi:hypothetical protein